MTFNAYHNRHSFCTLLYSYSVFSQSTCHIFKKFFITLSGKVSASSGLRLWDLVFACGAPRSCNNVAFEESGTSHLPDYQSQLDSTLTTRPWQLQIPWNPFLRPLSGTILRPQYLFSHQHQVFTPRMLSIRWLRFGLSYIDIYNLK